MTAPDITTEKGRRHQRELDEIAAAYHAGIKYAGRGFFQYMAVMRGYSEYEARLLADELGFLPRWRREVSDG